MLLSNEVEFKMMLTPVKTGSGKFSDVSHAICGYKPENFKISDYKYGKYFRIEGTVDYHNEQKMIDEIKDLFAGLIKEGHGSLIGFEVGYGNTELDRFSFEGLPAKEEEEDLDI